MGTWTPLHMHFFSSYLDGGIRYDQLKELKTKGCVATAITDHGNMSGTYEFYKEAKSAGIKPIIGCENYLAFDRSNKTDWLVEHRAKLRSKDPDNVRPNYHMILLAQNIEGYKNLCKINSTSWQEGFYFSPRMDRRMIEEHAGGLIGTSTCLGSETSQLILCGFLQEAEDTLRYYKELFNGKFFIELQGHPMQEQRIVNEQLLKFSKSLDIPIIITSDSHYMNCCDKQLHDKIITVGTHDVLANPKRFTFADLECHVPDYNELVLRCAEYNIPEEAIKNTNYVADMVTSNYFEDSMNRWPLYPKVPEGQTAIEHLGDLCMERAIQIYGEEIPEEVDKRVRKEIKTLKIMGYIDYMLIMADFIRFARSKNIIVGPGRGSAGGSMVAYLLGITEVDPLKHGLLFERFCNEGRAALPKIF